jgi:hypothetical protein
MKKLVNIINNPKSGFKRQGMKYVYTLRQFYGLPGNTFIAKGNISFGFFSHWAIYFLAGPTKLKAIIEEYKQGATKQACEHIHNSDDTYWVEV